MRGRGRPPSVGTRLLPRVKAQILDYLKTKGGTGGFPKESLLAFLDVALADSITWNVTGAARELLSGLHAKAWKEIHRKGPPRADRREKMLDAVKVFVGEHLDGEARGVAFELLERARDAAGDDETWDRLSDADKTGLAELCERADMPQVDDDDDDDGGQLSFTFAGGQKIERVIAFPDATVPGKRRSVLAEFCTIGQFELHTRMSRDHVDAADEATAEKEEKLAWLIDRSGGDRAAVIYALRDHQPEGPGDDERPHH